MDSAIRGFRRIIAPDTRTRTDDFATPEVESRYNDPSLETEALFVPKAAHRTRRRPPFAEAGFKPARSVRLRFRFPFYRGVPTWAPLAASLLMFALACTGGVAGEVPELENRALQHNKTRMCPVCPGESIDQSQNALAVQMRGIVADKLAEGWTENQVQDFFVERYGPSVLLEPPRSGIDLTAWIVPPVAVLIAGVVMLLVIKWMAKPDSERAEVEESNLTDDERNQYFQRIEAALEPESSRQDERPPV